MFNFFINRLLFIKVLNSIFFTNNLAYSLIKSLLQNLIILYVKNLITMQNI